ncbi:zinc ribbon domain-containing protein [Methanobrevibacter millerae]|uniref:Zinc-ribbon domain-containing protein n=1 Tax=Methanobrevibacter millerae TaxID=230361 RepID=A0A1G5V6N2_9EURY|nr:zinc ribbon domain-containing protein [Methanobrevibacter millerae]SDA41288.1 zinc-ribbon domain-containing protein [Methanobrevibacter millerae]
MKCKACGYENKSKAKFCSKCGNPLESTPNVSQQSKSSNSKIIIAVLIVVIAILALSIAYLTLSNNNEQASAVQQQPISSGSNDSAPNTSSSQQSSSSQPATTTTASQPKEWKLIGSYSGSGSGSQSVSVPAGQIMVKLSAFPIKNYATNHLYVTGSNGESAGVDWGSTSDVETRSNSLSYTSSSPVTFTIDYYETVSWQVDFYSYQ